MSKQNDIKICVPNSFPEVFGCIFTFSPPFINDLKVQPFYLIAAKFRKKTFLRKADPFLTNVLLLCPLKTSENSQFSDVFREYKSGRMVKNGLNSIFQFQICLFAFFIFSFTIYIITR